MRSPERARFLSDIICAAVEGGTNYWATCLAYRWMDRDTEQDLPPEEVYAVLADSEEMMDYRPGEQVSRQEFIDKLGKRVDIEVVATGIRKIQRDDFRINGTLKEIIRVGDRDDDAGMIDAEAADVIVQAGLFGEIVYG